MKYRFLVDDGDQIQMGRILLEARLDYIFTVLWTRRLNEKDSFFNG
jgi:hypothetical protein